MTDCNVKGIEILIKTPENDKMKWREFHNARKSLVNKPLPKYT